MQIATILIPPLLSLIGFFVKRANLKEEQKQAYIDFIETWQNLDNEPVAQYDDVQRQLQDFEDGKK